VVATLLSPLERGRAAKAKKAMSRPASTTGAAAVVQTIGSSIGAFLSAFGLLGYVASGLQPAPSGSSMLLFVSVDPIQNTACVLAGLALSTLATRWALRLRRP
jgi:hypothetical protein